MTYNLLYVLTHDYAAYRWTLGKWGTSDDNDYDKLEWHESNSKSKPTKNELEAKVNALVAAEPARLLRIERNKRLAETDWMANSDVTMSNDWKTYRQALRDLPSTQTPAIASVEEDETGLGIKNVTWPTKPS